MTKQTKVLASIAGVLAVGAVAGWAYFMNVGGLQGCMGRGCVPRSAPVDLSVTDLSVAETDYSGVPYYRVTAGLKSTAPEAEWQVTLNGQDYTQSMGWKSVPAKANTPYSFDIMQKVACEGVSSGTRSISINLDPNNKITESKEDNNGASVNFECKNAAVINSVNIVAVYQKAYFYGGSSFEKQFDFVISLEGKKLNNIKSVSSDDPTLNCSNTVSSMSPNFDEGLIDCLFTSSTPSGVKKVIFTDVLGLTHTFSVDLKLPIQAETPIITNLEMNGTLSLSNPKITWNNTKTAEQYAYIDGKFLHAYAYDVFIIPVDLLSGFLGKPLYLYNDASCVHDMYSVPDLNGKYLGQEWTCNNFTFPNDVLQKLEIGKKYNIYLMNSDVRDYGNGKLVKESVEAGVTVTVVK